MRNHSPFFLKKYKMKQGRNELCNCGSNKKYKKCCISLYEKSDKHNQVSIPLDWKLVKKLKKYRNELIENFENYSFKKTKELKWVKYYEDIHDISNELNVILKNTPPIIGECLNYSTLISSQIEGVNVVFGLMKVKKERRDYILSCNPHNGKKNLWFSFDKYRFYIDNNNELWNTHCWNSYNGYQFDCMRDELYTNWVNYRYYTEKPVNFKSLDEKELFISITLLDMFNMDIEDLLK